MLGRTLRSFDRLGVQARSVFLPFNPTSTITNGSQAFLLRLCCLPSINNRSCSSFSGRVPSAVGFNDYDAELSEAEINVPKHFNFATDVIDAWAARETAEFAREGRPAFWWVSETGREIKWDFKDISRESRRAANVLCQACGVRPDHRVLLILPKMPEWWLINLACIRIGAVVIPGTVQLTAWDIQQRIMRTNPKCIVCSEDIADKVDEIIESCPPTLTKVIVSDHDLSRLGWFNFRDLFAISSDQHKAINSLAEDVMTIFFTSGTTGLPKMTEHTHASYGIGHVRTGKYWLDLTPSDLHWNLSDPGWAKSSWSNLFAPWIQGACVFIHDSQRFTPEQTIDILSRYPISTFCTAPTAYRLIIQHDLSRIRQNKALRHCVSAGEPLNPDVIEKFYEGTGHVIREGYGQTETTLLCGSFRCIENKPGSMGKPVPGIDLRVIDAEGQTLPPGEEGDLAVKVHPYKPVGLFKQYSDTPARNAECYRGDFYLTGDRAYTDDEGYVWFVGRSDDVILSSGYRIGPFEVESALVEHEAVVEAAAISSPDEQRGEVVKAFVVLSEVYQTQDRDELTKTLQEHVKNITAPYKYPRKIEFVDSLPKTVSGKIRRYVLKNREWGKPDNLLAENMYEQGVEWNKETK